MSPRWRIAFLSLVVVGLELALSRQIPAEVRIFSHFTDLVLTGSLFGLGLGCLLQERGTQRWLLPGGLGVVAVVLLAARGVTLDETAPAVSFWLNGDARVGRALPVPVLPAALVTFLCSALPFVALGQALARAMDRRPRLVAWGWCVAGGLLGVGLATLGTIQRLPPWAGLGGMTILAAVVVDRTRGEQPALAAAGLAFLLLGRSPLPAQWSPYALVQHEQTETGLKVFVDSSLHQSTFAPTGGDETSRRQREAARGRRPYALYRERHGGPPESVLVLGAGTGDHVAAALAEGVSRVVAVEIDPVLLEIGRELNASEPFSDPRVETVQDDARHALRASNETFDLVVYGTLDSRVLLSGHARLRLEDLVYTREAFADAGDRLAEGGLLVVHAPARRDWLWPRLQATLQAVFGDRVGVLVEDEGGRNDATLVASRDLDPVGDGEVTVTPPGGGRPPTDDWPYLHMKRPTATPLLVRLLGAATVIVLGVLLLLHRIRPVPGLHANYLFLGMGVALLGTVTLHRLALPFGGTWVVEAVALSAALLVVFLANALVLRGRAPTPTLAWAGLCATLAVSSVVPVSSLLTLGPAVRATAAGLLVGAPVFCAALCFSHLFGRERITGSPLGMTLVGAMAGVLLQHVSMAVGIRALGLVVLAVCGLAWVSTLLAARSTT